ncbi:DDE superfamily endonuclease [Myxococcus virescens]|uniref:DDE superfamily endonuclease n=1 Tax=Myxococcus virescens TaxID=83456 RepID=A0ABY0MIN5_9BACT|nr:DDE superfamily endonuclease [Myxococcus virescens]
MRRRLARQLERELPGLEALVIDDTGFPKKGVHSVGVARQYSGTLGRTENCQVAVSLHLAGERGSGCIAMQLYLPEEWARSRKRCKAVGIPAGVKFQKKWQIALRQLDDALAWGVRRHLVLADAGYGDAREFRDGVRERGLHYLMGVQGSHKVWPPGRESPRGSRSRMGARARATWPRACSPGPSRSWRVNFPRRNSRLSFGARAVEANSPPALPPCACGRRSGTSSELRRVKRCGCSSSGPRRRRRRRSTRSARCPRTRHSRSWCACPSCAGEWSATTRNSKAKWGLTTSRGEGGEASTTTPPSAWSPTDSSRSAERFSPRRRTRWTLPEVRRRLQHLLLRRIGHCPLCLRHISARAPPRGPSRI